MSYDFQSIVVYRSTGEVKISDAGSNFYTTPDALNEKTRSADALWVSGLECVILNFRDAPDEPWNQSTFAFFRDYKKPLEKERFLTLEQAVNAGYHIERIMENGCPGNSIINELEWGPLPDKILRFLIELNVANVLDKELSPDDIKSILT